MLPETGASLPLGGGQGLESASMMRRLTCRCGHRDGDFGETELRVVSHSRRS